MSKIIVAGSSNIDMNVFIKSLPRPGETIGGGRFLQANGGKGANQAVAAGRLGGDVMFLTCVGDDMNGHMLEKQFQADGIDTSNMKFTSSAATGTALIFIAEDGENCIAVASGANDELMPEDMDAAENLFDDAEYLLVQMEIPSATIDRAIDIAYKKGVKVVLNPAPMRELSCETLSKLFLITPNETEAEKLTGITINSVSDAEYAADELMARGVRNVIITLGSTGSLVCDSQTKTVVPARKVEAVDTVGAGDVYNGALVTSLAEGNSLYEAARFATMASSIAVTRPGAQTGVPYRAEVDELMK